jgi:hypothetical protein
MFSLLEYFLIQKESYHLGLSFYRLLRVSLLQQNSMVIIAEIYYLVTGIPEVNPCNPSPCGANTQCRASGGTALCECLPGFLGNPNGSGCRPECVISSDCPRDKACVSTKCIDPCPGVCGYGAHCQVINHSPICSCPTPTIGDPFVECKEQPRKCTLFM